MRSALEPLTSKACQRKFKRSAPVIFEDFILSPAGPKISLGLRSISTLTSKTGHNLLQAFAKAQYFAAEVPVVFCP